MAPPKSSAGDGGPPAAGGTDATVSAGAGAADEPAVIEIEDVIDLHGFLPRDIPSVVEEYVLAAAQKGYREVRLIHGRGTGFQRNRVREVLAGLAVVDRFEDAPPSRGGWGATLVWLRP